MFNQHKLSPYVNLAESLRIHSLCFLLAWAVEALRVLSQPYYTYMETQIHPSVSSAQWYMYLWRDKEFIIQNEGELIQLVITALLLTFGSK